MAVGYREGVGFLGFMPTEELLHQVGQRADFMEALHLRANLLNLLDQRTESSVFDC